jgi:hypothetical protein
MRRLGRLVTLVGTAMKELLAAAASGKRIAEQQVLGKLSRAQQQMSACSARRGRGGERRLLHGPPCERTRDQYNVYWNQVMAASLVVSIPVVAGFLFLQRYFIAGLTAGSMK